MEDITEFTDAPADNALQSPTSTLPEGARRFIKEYAPQDDDSGCIVSFETVREFKPFKTRLAQEAAEREGREISPDLDVFENETFIRINIRGNDKIEVHRPVRDEDKRRFPFAWQEYQRGKQILARGTPLAKLGIDPSVIRQYQARNVWTVEDLARVDDNNLGNLGTSAREYRRAAQELIAKQQAPAPTAALEEQLAKMSAQLSQAMDLIAKQQQQIDEQGARRGPGRPPKDQAA